MNPLLSQYPNQSSRSTKTPWIMTVPVVSTIHITGSDRQQLADYWDRSDGDVLACIEGGTGHILTLDDNQGDDWSAYSADFRALLSAFAAKGYSYLRLDADGDVIDGWPTFE